MNSYTQAYEARSNTENVCVSQYRGASDIIYNGEIARLCRINIAC